MLLPLVVFYGLIVVMLYRVNWAVFFHFNNVINISALCEFQTVTAYFIFIYVNYLLNTYT